MTSTTDSEAILRGVLDRWKAAVDAHEPERVAACFTEDAIFQGLRPYSVGRQGVAEYYESQPLGLTARYEILETRGLADDLVLGYHRVEFDFTDRPPRTVNLSLLVKRSASGWYIALYQVSLLPDAHRRTPENPEPRPR
ncbi:YybH family protein [Streptomyces scopuliridis]|uniref:YybH family protein n=1 Tax=Streptomyces scopuliridis TaxID=452529 RepID=UPI0036BE8117